MSRFDDLDQHLRREEAARQEAEAQQIRKLLEAKDRQMLQLRRAYEAFGDFYKTILMPKGYIAVPRKKEGPSPNEFRHKYGSIALYAYVINVLSPQSEQPYPNDAYNLPIWAQPTITEGEGQDWHPNVGLQFATALTTEVGTTMDDVRLSVEMRAWGKVDFDKDALVRQGISAYVGDGGWDHIATSVTIGPGEARLEDQIETGLRILTPNIIHHKAAFNYRR